MYAFLCKLAQFWPLSFLVGCLSLELVLCSGQRVARSNRKRNRTAELSFTKILTILAAVVEVLIDTDNIALQCEAFWAPHGAWTHLPFNKLENYWK